jgi:hypothetical protein
MGVNAISSEVGRYEIAVGDDRLNDSEQVAGSVRRQSG